MGIDLEIVRDRSLASHGGVWVGVKVDPSTGELQGGVTAGVNGLAEGH